MCALLVGLIGLTVAALELDADGGALGLGHGVVLVDAPPDADGVVVGPPQAPVAALLGAPQGGGGGLVPQPSTATTPGRIILDKAQILFLLNS